MEGIIVKESVAHHDLKIWLKIQIKVFHNISNKLQDCLSNNFSCISEYVPDYKHTKLSMLYCRLTRMVI